MEEDKLVSLALENDEEAKETIYAKYKYVVDILIHKYSNIAIKYEIDLNELEQEAYYAFWDAINNYRDDKNTKLETFISLCVDRRLKKIIKRYSNKKAQFFNNSYSLDYNYEDDITLQDRISDDYQFEPLHSLTLKENYEELVLKIKKVLSESEYEIYNYMLNEFDNAMQRIKKKIRDIMSE